MEKVSSVWGTFQIKDTLRTVKGEGVFIDAICIEDSEGISDQEFLRNSVQTPVNIGQINFLNDPADNRTIRAWLIQKAHQPQPAKTSRGSKWSFQNVITAGSFQLSLN